MTNLGYRDSSTSVSQPAVPAGEEGLKPLLKWAGGKRHIAATVANHFPPDWNQQTYFEPFLGGAAMFLYLQPKRAVLNDVNSHLVRFYHDVQDNCMELLGMIRSIAREFDAIRDGEILAPKKKADDLSPEQELEHQGLVEAANQDAAERDGKQCDFFYRLRTEFNEGDSSITHSARMYALNKLCFNGLYRENSRGLYNVPFGKKRAFPEVSNKDFLAVAAALQQAKIINEDFKEAVKSASEGDFVYFDPPYVPVNITSSFTSYSSGGFGHKEQESLATLMKELAGRGVRALLSNSATQITRDIYRDFTIETISAPRMVSATDKGRGSVSEFLIMNY